MSGRVEGKVAFITGAARGQGRTHAVRLAAEGADIIALDIADQIDIVPFAMGTREDLDETARQVKALGRRVVTSIADVRDYPGLREAVDEGVAELGRLDIVSANAGIFSFAPIDQLTDSAWSDVIDVNLKGVWHTIKAALPHLRESGGGSIILTGSTAAVDGLPNAAHYVAAKHGVVGIMRTAALELAKENIRVNAVHPGNVNTPMIQNPALYELFAPDLEPAARTLEAIVPRVRAMSVMPVPWVEPEDVSNAVLWLASDESRYVTGLGITVDAGRTLL